MITLYYRYVDDTLLLVKSADVPKIYNLLNEFGKNVCFTVDRFEKEAPHFLDIKISPLGRTIYRKNTHTGQYINFESYTPCSTWNY